MAPVVSGGVTSVSLNPVQDGGPPQVLTDGSEDVAGVMVLDVLEPPPWAADEDSAVFSATYAAG
jgi:hypothetical protein